MDAALLQAIATLLLGSGGLLGAVNYYRARRSRRVGVPAQEHPARVIADRDGLNTYFQTEVAAFRKERAKELAELRGEIINLRHLRHLDSLYIDQLEEHIYMRREPPPPRRSTEQ